MKKKWTKEELETLVQLLKEGKNAKYLCSYFNRSFGSINAKITAVRAEGKLDDN